MADLFRPRISQSRKFLFIVCLALLRCAALLECGLLLLKVRPMVPAPANIKSVLHSIGEERDTLRPNSSDEDDESSDGAKEDALHRSVVGHDCGLPILDDRCFQMLPAYRLDLRGCCRYHLPSRASHSSFSKQVAKQHTFPIWYATPGKVARNPGGLISASCMGITPHAPCTPNCTQKAPAASVLIPDGSIQSGMKTPLNITNKIMVSRRPIC